MPAMMCNDEACRFAVLMIKRVSIILTLIFWCAVHLHAQEKMNLKVIGKDKGNEALTALMKVPPEFSSEQSINNFLQHQLLPPTINYHEPDPSIQLNVVPNQAEAFPVKSILSNSFGFGGTNASLIFKRFS